MGAMAGAAANGAGPGQPRASVHGAHPLQSQSPEADDVDVCHICFVNEADAVALECGHGGLCFQCGIRIKTDTMAMARDGAKCPTCRHPMDYLLRIPPPRLHTSALIRCLLDSDEERAASTLAAAASAAAHRLGVGRSFMLDSVPRGSAGGHRHGTSMAGIVIAGPAATGSASSSANASSGGNGQGRARGRGFHRARSSLGSALALIAEDTNYDDHHRDHQDGNRRTSVVVAAHESGAVTAPPDFQNASTASADAAASAAAGAGADAQGTADAGGASHSRRGSGDATAPFLAASGAAANAQPRAAAVMAARMQPQMQRQPGPRVASERSGNGAASSVDTAGPPPFSRAAAEAGDTARTEGLPGGPGPSASALARDAISEVLSPSGLRRRAVPASATSQQGLLDSAATTTATASPAVSSPLAAAISMPERLISPAAALGASRARQAHGQAPESDSTQSALRSPAAHARAAASGRSARSDLDGTVTGGAATADPADVAERGQLLQAALKSPPPP